jgi:predicted ATPase
MITNLNISNFKLHKKTKLDIKGLTILTGMNGMGKSTVIQSLILLRQSFMMNDLETGLNLKGDLCDAGISGELACQSSDEHILTIDLKFSNQDELTYVFNYPGNIMDTLLPGVESNVTDKAFLSKYSLFNEYFQYLSAFRFGPQKSYNRDTSLVVSKKQISKIMGQCEYAVHFLDQYKNVDIPVRELAIIDEKEDITPDLRLSVQVERWLRMISPNIKIIIEPSGEDFKLKYKFNREENTITEDMTALNTGFGITYALPLLIAILSAHKDSIILIENPEAHIHPKGQAILMELMARAVANGIQIIIESHSDHIINGSLVAINKNLITPDQLSIYYFNREEHQHVAVSHPLEISRNGHIKRPPQGFFDQIDIDLKTLTGF